MIISDTRELNRLELDEAIEALEDTVDDLAAELEIIERDMQGLQAQDEDYATLHERRIEVTSELCRTVISKRQMRELLGGLGSVFEVDERAYGTFTRVV